MIDQLLIHICSCCLTTKAFFYQISFISSAAEGLLDCSHLSTFLCEVQKNKSFQATLNSQIKVATPPRTFQLGGHSTTNIQLK